jgi:hypothetical protein
MNESRDGSPPAGGEPDVVHQGLVSLAAIGVAVLLIVSAGVVGVTMGMRGGTHTMMWGGATARVQPAAAVAPADGMPTATGFQLDGLTAHVVQHYGLARANPSIYAQVPCFCGCQDMLGHRNLEDCFVTPDGAWESHAAGCAVCIQESQMMQRMMVGGMGPDMMHDRIVGRFGGPMMSS